MIAIFKMTDEYGKQINLNLGVDKDLTKITNMFNSGGWSDNYSTDQLKEMNSYIVKSVEGISSVQANIITSDYVNKDGSIFQNSKTGYRNIVFTIGYNTYQDYYYDNVEYLRQKLASFFIPKSKINIQVDSTRGYLMTIEGYVESFEPVLFSKNPEVVVSIICPDPYFKGFVALGGYRTGSGSIDFYNQGDVETGLIFLIDGFYSSVPDFTITKTTNYNEVSEVMTYTGSKYSGGNLLTFYITTDIGKKSALMKVQDPGYEPGSALIYTPPSGASSVLGLIDGWLMCPPGLSSYQIILNESSYPLPAISIGGYAKFSGI
jgi:hypothetical protein